MALFSGPPNTEVDAFAQQLAALFLLVEEVELLPSIERQAAREEMRSKGTPATMAELFAAALQFKTTHKLGGFKKGRLVSTTYFSLLQSGMPMPNAQAIAKGLEQSMK
jgi:hypothetical protein